MTLQIEIVPIPSDNYAYLVRDEASGRVACVDPGEAAPVLAAAEEKGWEIDTILITHHHGDHVGGVATIKAYGRNRHRPGRRQPAHPRPRPERHRR